MEIFRTDDNSVTKFIHQDGSETAIKCVLSQSTFIDRNTGKVEIRYADREKYSIFISSSTGCYLKCPQCWLTLKDSMYRKLTGANILANIQEALEAEMEARPELANRYVKLCWMGMGDALSQPDDVREASLQLLDWILEKGYAKGLDSVDLSTVGPRVSPRWIYAFATLNKDLARFPHNPKSAEVEQAELSNFSRYKQRSSFRLFYSLHSGLQSTRDTIAPNTLDLVRMKDLLLRFRDTGVTLIFHQLFVEGINDSMAEVEALLDFLKDFPNSELRVLRYNSCDRSPYREWPEIEAALQHLARQHPLLKVQSSAGTEVQAACGQFLVAMPRALEKTA